MLSLKQQAELVDKNDSLRTKAEALKNKAERGIEVATGIGLAGGTGFVLGYLAQENKDNPGQEPTYGDSSDGKGDGVKLSTIVGGLAAVAAVMTKKGHMARNFSAIAHTAVGISSFQFAKDKAKEWDEDDGGDNAKTKGKNVVRQMRQMVEGSRMADYANRQAVRGLFNPPYQELAQPEL